jgi:hypothetical protein
VSRPDLGIDARDVEALAGQGRLPVSYGVLLVRVRSASGSRLAIWSLENASSVEAGANHLAAPNQPLKSQTKAVSPLRI